MKSEEIQKYIQNLSPELYSFAYVLVPDDLQASQLMIDSVQSFLIQKKVFIDKILDAKNKINQAHFEELKMSLLKIIFELSKKRYQQLKMSLKVVEQESSFFSLDFEEKAVLYLRDKMQMELIEIEYLTGLNKPELMAFLYSARMKIVEILPSLNPNQTNIQSGGML